MKFENSIKNKNEVSKILVFVAIAFLIVFFTARYATDEEFRTLIDVNILKKEITESTLNSIEVDLEANPKIFAYDKYISIFSKNKLCEYDSSGVKVADLDINISVPLIHTNGKYAVMAEKDGQNIYLISGGQIIWKNSVEGNISDVNVNENGYVSIIIKNTTYKSVIAFIDPTGLEVFRTYLWANYALCTSISTNNKYLAIGEVDYSGTILKSFVKIVSVEKAQSDPKNSMIYTYESDNGEVITDINYQDKEIATCMFNTYVQKVGIDSNERVYDMTENDLFVDIGFKDAMAIIDKQSSGLFSYEYEINLKNANSKAESLYILDSDLPKSLHVSGYNMALNLGNEIRIVNSNGWLVKRYISNNQIKSIVLGDSVAGVVYKNRIEIINL